MSRSFALRPQWSRLRRGNGLSLSEPKTSGPTAAPLVWCADSHPQERAQPQENKFRRFLGHPSMDSRGKSALLRERASLEQRLSHVNCLLQNDGGALPSSAACRSDHHSRVDGFGEIIGLAPESGRFLLFLIAVAFIYARGRDIAHAIGVLLISSSVTVWACWRRLFRKRAPN